MYILRADFCSFYKCCKLNLLELNLKKCKHMTFFTHSKIEILSIAFANAVLDKGYSEPWYSIESQAQLSG